MPQQRQQSASDRLSVRIRSDSSDRIPHRLSSRARRQARPTRRPSLVVLFALALILLLVLAAAFRRFKGSRGDFVHGDEDLKSDLEFRPRSNWSLAYSKEVGFGHGSKVGKDSRYWDKDDRRRDKEFTEEDLPEEKLDGGKERILENGSGGNEKRVDGNNEESPKSGARLYNEGGRAELDSYKVEYETLLSNSTEEEYDDDSDDTDLHDEIDEADHDNEVQKLEELDGGEKEKVEESRVQEKDSSLRGMGSFGSSKIVNTTAETGKVLDRKTGSKRKPKRRKFSSCPINLLNSTTQIVEPPENQKFARFSLQYTDTEEMPSGSKNWEPRFAGHQTLQEREESFYARDQKINCGFVKGPAGSPSTGFDISVDDKKFLSSCHIAVSSCIFGSSDRLRSPFSKTITSLSRKNACFVMFVDEETMQTLQSDGQKMDAQGFIGLWKVVVVKNLPYEDMRRVGKVPKFLAHRLFPSARYSIWLDSKLRLQIDPYLILERFLWRHTHEYAISNHYDRHCVWEEVMQNKKLNKYNHTVIDQQFEFYQSDGLKKFDPTDPKKLLPSNVPEGSFIVREHTPMSNLFSCLWFNEVDRFTSRDQLSFAYTFLKLRRMNPDKPLYLNMFKDCERRAMAKLFHHRAEEKQASASTQSAR